MGSSDSHDAFTEPGGNAPKHDEAFTQPNKDAPTGSPMFPVNPTLLSQTELHATVWSWLCNFHFKLNQSFMESFGDRFDDLTLPSFDTGGTIKGAELRHCQTGCEMLEKMGYHKFGMAALMPGLKCGCKQFDEQLQFVNEEDKPLSNVDYVITRTDGMKVKGTTDAEGKTKRIKNTQQEMAIEEVDFFATKWTQPLCPLSRIPVGTLLETVQMAEKTTQANVGSSVKKVTLKGKGRPLTAGEIAMAQPVFKDGINYSKVKVYKKKYWLALGFQPNDIGMVPDGNLYCPESIFSEDFSTDAPRFKIWFMHEMTHVWQTQLGLSTILSAADLFSQGGYKDDKPPLPPAGYRYDPAKDKGKTLPDFNFEQQAEIVSHYFAAKYLNDSYYVANILYYESVLKNFLVKSKDKGLLPREEAGLGPVAHHGIYEY